MSQHRKLHSTLLKTTWKRHVAGAFSGKMPARQMPAPHVPAPHIPLPHMPAPHVPASLFQPGGRGWSRSRARGGPLAPRSGGNARSGLTLLEVVLSMGLLVLVSAMTFWFYASVLETRERETERARTFRLARVVVGQIADELRQATAIAIGSASGASGGPEHIRIATLRVPAKDLLRRRSILDEDKEGESDLVVTEYRIARHPDIVHEDGYELPLGLARLEFKLPRSPAEERGAGDRGGEESGEAFGLLGGEPGAGEDEFAGEFDFSEETEDDFGDASLEPDINWEELYAPEIKYLRFCYFDGKTWWDEWELSGGNTLPQLVQVTIGYEGGPPFGEEFMSQEEEEFCTCMNEDPSDCERLAGDRYSAIVRLPQADALFSSHIQKELSELLKELGAGDESEDESGDGLEGLGGL